METNNIDKIVRDSLKSRTIQPSNSAWERLNVQLDAVPQKKKNNWFLYVGYAASVLLLISVAFFINPNKDIHPTTPNTIDVVVTSIDTTSFVKPTFKNTVPVENAIVKADKVEEQSVISERNSKSTKRNSIIKNHKKIEKPITNVETAIAVVNVKEDSTKIRIPVVKKNPDSRIKVNSDDLLYAVTHSKEEVEQYYAKYNVNRDDVLKTIQKELKKANLKVDANILLADVEKNIDEETFKKSFMQVVKGKITGLAEAFVNRNN